LKRFGGGKYMQRVNSKIGDFIEERRQKNGLSRAQLAARIGVNPNYLQEVEQGNQIPHDKMIRNFAEYFKLDENILFEMAGRVPLVVREELESQTLLQSCLKEMAKSKVSEEKKQEIYQEFLCVVQRVASNA
jgi:transcriptional regulator with XRE-family HTH domain